MPTSTFFRLPEEKRQRLLEAAQAEFTQTSFGDASINKIIQNAHIPRGSFYQYFEDKSDLFLYLMRDMRDYFHHALMEILEKSNGDLLAVPLRAFDRFLGRSGGTDPVLGRCIQIMQVNPSMDMSWLFERGSELFSDSVYDRMDVSRFRRTDHAFIDHTFFLVIMPLAHAIMETLRTPDRLALQREILQERVEIIKFGTLKPNVPNKEDTPCATTN